MNITFRDVPDPTGAIRAWPSLAPRYPPIRRPHGIGESHPTRPTGASLANATRIHPSPPRHGPRARPSPTRHASASERRPDDPSGYHWHHRRDDVRHSTDTVEMFHPAIPGTRPGVSRQQLSAPLFRITDIPPEPPGSDHRLPPGVPVHRFDHHARRSTVMISPDRRAGIPPPAFPPERHRL